ncbi:hypothetical protein [Salimicrobium humidisoli]|uniref:SdpI/YhfL protein family protein n=1 Tax=Salimicrobium humidisoli TaxID=2029857 RepID=A0ABX4HQV8_9BACI|nr:hypothetical protein [Salimicrobium humidisoli]PBB05584.1 hypothetical protein CKW00_08355 [Salimicrobium humidisoli]
MNIIIPIISTVVVITMFSFAYKNKQKVDEGFKVNYFSLSYRRKMIRTLMTSPFMLLAITGVLLLLDSDSFTKILFTSFLLMVFVIQFVYNYYMWKKKET